MAVFRVEKNKNYTVMSNHHLKDKELSLKSKGLLSVVLSLPDEWNYSTRGLAAICKEGVDSIGAALRELEAAGYIERHMLRDERGRITDTEYIIYEFPQPKPDTDKPDTPLPHTPSPYTENPYTAEPDTEKPSLYKDTNIQSKKEVNPDSLNIHQSISADAPDTMDAMDIYREILKENIEYDTLCQQYKYQTDEINEILELMLETVCSTKKTIRIGGEDKPVEVVKSRMMKLDQFHVEYALETLGKNTNEVRNIRSYLLTTLYNAPGTIGSYYKQRVQHDMYGEN